MKKRPCACNTRYCLYYAFQARSSVAHLVAFTMRSRLEQTELRMQYAQLLLPGNCPEGVYLSAMEKRDQVQGVIFVRQGYFQGSILRFSISFPSAKGQVAPVVNFDHGALIHPLVNPSDDRLSIAFGFPSWDPQLDNLTKLLFFIKSIFKTYTLDKLNDGLAVNSEAWRLYRHNRSVFAKLAAQCATVSSSSNTLFARPGSASESKTDFTLSPPQSRPDALSFRQLSDAEMDEVQQSIFAG